ncbi:MAG: hypothetical protein K2X39_07645, partial [Silvanigrellaceae bacterium]|nr:hypothetical protein [Silvanigrellaceae bacterium]
NYVVSGSDSPIYPPMDKVIADLGIQPYIHFKAENIENAHPDFIVLANVLSRVGASLQSNEELEHILQQNIPILSFPSSLRKYFLHKSLNIVVSGTHGKTTTSSLITYALMGLGKNPSYLIGGSPVNLDSSFALNSPDLFVLEGDEYDSAFFDKGPKFLHYEPSIAIINNIEFDHADIYPNIEAIEEEFLKLALLTKDKQGFVIANLSDKRVVKIVEKSGVQVIGFSRETEHSLAFPCWQLKSMETDAQGITVDCLSPDGSLYRVKSGVYGVHNALNIVATFAAMHALFILEQRKKIGFLPGTYDSFFSTMPFSSLCSDKIVHALSSFKGVKRRFELIGNANNIFIFDDFAHHPTAIATTLEAFRSYMNASKRPGRLIACFDPRNATMRRRVLQEELKSSFHTADLILIGKVAQDLRMKSEEVLNAEEVAHSYGKKACSFVDNLTLLEYLCAQIRPGDTVVFMSSGSFDNLPKRFLEELNKQKKE